MFPATTSVDRSSTILQFRIHLCAWQIWYFQCIFRTRIWDRVDSHRKWRNGFSTIGVWHQWIGAPRFLQFRIHLCIRSIGNFQCIFRTLHAYLNVHFRGGFTDTWSNSVPLTPCSDDKRTCAAFVWRQWVPMSSRHAATCFMWNACEHGFTLIPYAQCAANKFPWLTLWTCANSKPSSVITTNSNYTLQNWNNGARLFGSMDSPLVASSPRLCSRSYI